MTVPGSESAEPSLADALPKTGMRVELPRLLSVLSHELRGPLSVLQGYIRLMQRQREDGHPETAMLKAMLDATGRITSLGRQASELSSWLAPREKTPLKTSTLGALVANVRERVAQAHGTVDLDAVAADEAIESSDPQLLASAIATLMDAHYRELGNAPVSMSVAADVDDVHFTIRPAGDSPARDGGPGAVAFDRGGLGLGLILASYVLDAHDARATSGGSIMEIHLRKKRGFE